MHNERKEMNREAFDIDVALEKCHSGTAWERDLIREQLIAAQADAYERAAKACEGERLGDDVDCDEDVAYNSAIRHAAHAIRALAKGAT